MGPLCEAALAAWNSLFPCLLVFHWAQEGDGTWHASSTGSPKPILCQFANKHLVLLGHYLILSASSSGESSLAVK